MASPLYCSTFVFLNGFHSRGREAFLIGCFGIALNLAQRGMT
jgi:hypothetical protein